LGSSQMNHKRCSFSDTHLRCILIDFGFAPLLSLFPSFTFPALLLPPVDTCSSPRSICLSCVIQRQAALNQNHFRANCHSFPDPFWQWSGGSTPLLTALSTDLQVCSHDSLLRRRQPVLCSVCSLLLFK